MTEAKKEKELKQIMKDVECSYEEALEIFKMEQKAKANGTDKICNQSNKPRAKAKREPKIDADKLELVKRIHNALNVFTAVVGDIQNLTVVNNQREVTFTYKGAEYSVVLTKHRTKKN